MLLALDLGMHTGWALFTRAGARLASGVWHLGKDQVRGRFGELLLYLRTKVGAQGVKRVAYEHVHHHTGIDAGHVYGGWLAVLDPITTSEIHAIEASNGSLEVSTKFPPYTLDTLDELRERQRDTDVLVRWAEFVAEYATARLTRGDASAAMNIVESMSIDDSDEEFLRQIGDLAVAHEVNLEGVGAVEALINLALTLRELHAIVGDG